MMLRSTSRSRPVVALGIAMILLGGCASLGPTEHQHAHARELPSWRDGETRTAILDFVQRVTDVSSPDYVAPPERIAVFDNDGTLWSERPMYVQLAFALDRIAAAADEHPEWRTTEPFSFVLEGDLGGLASAGEHGIVEIVLATHAGTDTEKFRSTVADWLETARHPDTGRPYTEMVYQPMLELLEFLRANDFETWIVSGGGVDFMRVFAEEVYGIPTEQVIGSLGDMNYEIGPDGPRLLRLPGIAFIDDKAGKPIAIHRSIGRRPIAAFGNSDGDFEMLEWTTAGDGPRLGVYIHHTDAEREVAYDRTSSIGRLDRGLDEAGDRGWIVVDMAEDWTQVFKASPVEQLDGD
jgi:phosphoglycolate phosphatase-like HAD superfamily hydrolase